VLTEAEEVSIVVEENRSRGLLVIGVIARVEHFNARLLAKLNKSRGDTVAMSLDERDYPEAPVPKSIAIT